MSTLTPPPASRGGDPARAPVDVGASDRRRGRCGWCGQRGALTKTHVPPQAVGNTGEVQRIRLKLVGDEQERFPPRLGGLWVKGQCGRCNSDAGARFDGAYKQLNDALGPAYLADRPLILPTATHRPRPVDIQAGAAARSMLVAAFALNPRLRTIAPDLAAQVRSRDPFQLPATLDLRLAVAVGRRARVTGSIGLMRFGLTATGELLTAPFGTAIAQCYYPPVAWQLVFHDDAVLCDAEGWPSIRHWCELPEDGTVRLSDLCGPLPLVMHPRHHPRTANMVGEMFSAVTTFVIEADDIAPSVSRRR